MASVLQWIRPPSHRGLLLGVACSSCLCFLLMLLTLNALHTLPDMSSAEDTYGEVYLRQLAAMTRASPHHKQTTMSVRWPKDELQEYDWNDKSGHSYKGAGKRGRSKYRKNAKLDDEVLEQLDVKYVEYYMQEIDLDEADMADIKERNAKHQVRQQLHTGNTREETSSEGRRAIYISARGGLATQMFQYAAVYSLARRQGRVGFVSKDMLLWDAFRRLTLQRQQPPISTKSLKEKQQRFYDDSFNSLPDTDIKVCCYLQSWRYFTDYTYSLRRQFRFKNQHARAGQELLAHHATDIIQRLTQGNKAVTNSSFSADPPKSASDFTYIAVHIRIGSRLQAPYIRHGYKIAPASYIHNAMDYYRKKHSNCLFLVFSSAGDKSWCMENLQVQQMDVVVTSNSTSQEEDLAAMAQCNHTVTSTGAFSWWAAWLANGDATYFANITTPGSTQAQRMNLTDYFPAKWIPIPE